MSKLIGSGTRGGGKTRNERNAVLCYARRCPLQSHLERYRKPRNPKNPGFLQCHIQPVCSDAINSLYDLSKDGMQTVRNEWDRSARGSSRPRLLIYNWSSVGARVTIDLSIRMTYNALTRDNKFIADDEGYKLIVITRPRHVQWSYSLSDPVWFTA